jgi:lysophospholipase L1-like esterase
MRHQARSASFLFLAFVGAATAGSFLLCCGDETTGGTNGAGATGTGGGSTAPASASSGTTGEGGAGGAGGQGGEGGSASGETIRFLGRFDNGSPEGPRAGWPGSAIITRFTGTSISVRFKDTAPPAASDYFQIVLDGEVKGALEVNNQGELFQVASSLAAGPHDLLLHKRTEGFVGTTQFLEFVVNDGEGLLPVKPAPERRIEIIGDSISAGYGVDGPNESCSFTSATENNYLAYGPVAARQLGADVFVVAWSGIGAYRNYGGNMNDTMPDVYPRTIPSEAAPTWDFSAWIPHAVVINLGTNDFSVGDPGEQPFTDAYKKLVAAVRGNYKDAYIFCAVGPMLSDSYPPGQQQLTKARAYVKKVVDDLTAQGDGRMRFIEFPTQDAANGLGCDYHPSVKTNQLMADQLAQALKSELGW